MKKIVIRILVAFLIIWIGGCTIQVVRQTESNDANNSAENKITDVEENKKVNQQQTNNETTDNRNNDLNKEKETEKSEEKNNKTKEKNKNKLKENGEWALDSNYMFAIDVNDFNGDNYASGTYTFDITNKQLGEAPMYDIYITNQEFSKAEEVIANGEYYSIGGVNSPEVKIDLNSGNYVYIMPYKDLTYEPNGYLIFERLK